jgi:hypothetical protein
VGTLSSDVKLKWSLRIDPLALDINSRSAALSLGQLVTVTTYSNPLSCLKSSDSEDKPGRSVKFKVLIFFAISSFWSAW